MIALAALTERLTLATLRDDLLFTIFAPIGNFVVFNFALRNVIDTGQMSYPQYLVPVIIIQVIFLCALITIERAANEQQSGFGIRLRTLPIPTVVPLTARMLHCLLQTVLALLSTLIVASAFGFRMDGGLPCVAAFVMVVLVFALALSLGADAAGTRLGASVIGRNGMPSQLFVVPLMLLIMLSTGMAPTDSFPDWLQPFVRYQPVSEVTESLRAFTTGDVYVGNILTTVAWCLILLLAFGALAIRMHRRSQ